ncbi:hypothetical protein C8T65DRAFT_738580 [Cerioporus squamosus]|nr:hypothetical protein C8T65DRAFT_738580 [Cerioporus squamosus]
MSTADTPRRTLGDLPGLSRKCRSVHAGTTAGSARGEAEPIVKAKRNVQQEGSWVYVDGWKKAFNKAFNKLIAGSDLPAALLHKGGAGDFSREYDLR